MSGRNFYGGGSGPVPKNVVNAWSIYRFLVFCLLVWNVFFFSFFSPHRFGSMDRPPNRPNTSPTFFFFSLCTHSPRLQSPWVKVPPSARIDLCQYPRSFPLLLAVPLRARVYFLAGFDLFPRQIMACPRSTPPPQGAAEILFFWDRIGRFLLPG